MYGYHVIITRLICALSTAKMRSDILITLKNKTARITEKVYDTVNIILNYLLFINRS